MVRLSDDPSPQETAYEGGGRDSFIRLVQQAHQFDCDECGTSIVNTGLYVKAQSIDHPSWSEEYCFLAENAALLCGGCGGADGTLTGLPDDDGLLERLREDAEQPDVDSYVDPDEVAPTTEEPESDQDDDASFEVGHPRVPHPREALRRQGRPDHDLPGMDDQEDPEQFLDNAPSSAMSTGSSTDSQETPRPGDESDPTSFAQRLLVLPAGLAETDAEYSLIGRLLTRIGIRGTTSNIAVLVAVTAVALIGVNETLPVADTAAAITQNRLVGLMVLTTLAVGYSVHLLTRASFGTEGRTRVTAPLRSLGFRAVGATIGWTAVTAVGTAGTPYINIGAGILAAAALGIGALAAIQVRGLHLTVTDTLPSYQGLVTVPLSIGTRVGVLVVAAALYADVSNPYLVAVPGSVAVTLTVLWQLATHHPIRGAD